MRPGSRYLRDAMRSTPPVPFLAVVLLGCSAAPPRVMVEDEARAAAPIPACVLRLPPRKPESKGLARTLREEQYWQLVYPTFSSEDSTLPNGAVDCVGIDVFKTTAFSGTKPVRSPLKIEEGDIMFGAGADRLKIVWLRSHRGEDGVVAGAIALVRTLETEAEVYAVGTYKGVPAATRFGIERIGPNVLVTSIEDGCRGRKPNTPCESRVTVNLVYSGRLVPVTEVITERVVYASDSEPGFPGRVEYHMTSGVEFSAKGLRVLEQIRVSDVNGAPLRKLELDRMMVLDGAKPMKATAESLWGRLQLKKS